MPICYQSDQDLFRYPNPLVISGAGQVSLVQQVTVGDLHGNALKLMFILLKHQIASMAKEDYEKFVEIYNTPVDELTESQLNEFNAILLRITFNPIIPDSKIRQCLTLIGDELADRGSNDYFTLKILQALKNAEIPFEIILSNHGLAFIEAYEKHDCDFNSLLSGLGSAQAKSMESLKTLIDKGFVSKDEIKAIIENVYKPALRAISYSLNQSQPRRPSLTGSSQQQTITIYSHAPIGLRTIEHLARKLKVGDKISNEEELARTIEEINRAFRVYVQNNTIHTLYNPVFQDPPSSERAEIYQQHHLPFERITWNRHYEDLYRPEHINFVHGHDRTRQKPLPNVFNLDSAFGGPGSRLGEYIFFYSPKAPLRPMRPTRPAHPESVAAPIPAPVQAVPSSAPAKSPMTPIAAMPEQTNFDPIIADIVNGGVIEHRQTISKRHQRPSSHPTAEGAGQVYDPQPLSGIIESFKSKIFDTPESKNELARVVSIKRNAMYNFDDAFSYLMTKPSETSDIEDWDKNVQEILAPFLRRKATQYLLDHKDEFLEKYHPVRTAQDEALSPAYPEEFLEYIEQQSQDTVFASELAILALSQYLSFTLNVTKVREASRFFTDYGKPKGAAKSLFTLHLFHENNHFYIDNGEPASTVGNGNCFYNAVGQAFVRKAQRELIISDASVPKVTSARESLDNLLKYLIKFAGQNPFLEILLQTERGTLTFNEDIIFEKPSTQPTLADLQNLGIDLHILPWIGFATDLGYVTIKPQSSGQFVIELDGGLINIGMDEEDELEADQLSATKAFCRNLNTIFCGQQPEQRPVIINEVGRNIFEIGDKQYNFRELLNHINELQISGRFSPTRAQEIVAVRSSSGKTILHDLVHLEKPSTNVWLSKLLNLLPSQMLLLTMQTKDNDGNTLLHLTNNSTKLIAIISSLPIKYRLVAVQEKNTKGETPLHRAVTGHAIEEILTLLPAEDCLAALNEKDATGQMVLHRAESNLESLKRILSLYSIPERLIAVQAINPRTGRNFRAFIEALQSPYKEEFLALLPNEASPDLTIGDASPALEQESIPQLFHYISTPGSEPASVAMADDKSGFSYCEDKHERPEQEDALCVHHYDPSVSKDLSTQQIGHRLWTALQVIDQGTRDEKLKSGSTASVTVFDGKGNLITATLGDAVSFAVMRNAAGEIEKIIRLNKDVHKPGDPNERRRVERSGGAVFFSRVDGCLAVSRALGDGEFGDKVCAVATIDITPITDISILKGSSIQIITTCDGFTDGAGRDKQRKEDHEQFLRSSIASFEPAKDLSLAQHLVASAKGISKDNISVAIQELRPFFPFLLAVFDGHGGSEVSHYAATHMMRIFEEQCGLSPEGYASQPLSADKKILDYYRDNPSSGVSSAVLIEGDKEIPAEARTPEGIRYIGAEAYLGAKMSTISISEGVIEIGEGAFQKCTNLQTIKIPSTLNRIGKGVFWECSSLKTIKIPSTVRKISDYAFALCKGLDSITLESGITEIGEGAFMFCEALAEITLPSSVSVIKGAAFSSCTGLKTITIPSSITAIGHDIFSASNNLEKIIIVSRLEVGTAKKEELSALFPEKLRPKITFLVTPTADLSSAPAASASALAAQVPTSALAPAAVPRAATKGPGKVEGHQPGVINRGAVIQPRKILSKRPPRPSPAQASASVPAWSPAPVPAAAAPASATPTPAQTARTSTPAARMPASVPAPVAAASAAPTPAPAAPVSTPAASTLAPAARTPASAPAPVAAASAAPAPAPAAPVSTPAASTPAPAARTPASAPARSPAPVAAASAPTASADSSLDIAFKTLEKSIKDMKQYGKKLLKKQRANEGEVIITLAASLKKELQEFSKTFKEAPTAKQFEEFKIKFTNTLHSQDSKIKIHNQKWKPIFANILIALTGIGAVLLIGNLLKTKVNAYQTGSSLSINSSLFFAKTNREKRRSAVERELNKLDKSSQGPNKTYP